MDAPEAALIPDLEIIPVKTLADLYNHLFPFGSNTPPLVAGYFIVIPGEGGGKVVFSPLSPREIQRMKRGKRGRLSKYAGRNLLLSVSPRSMTYELTALNGGILFNLELPLVWNCLTDQKVDGMEWLWMYMV